MEPAFDRVTARLDALLAEARDYNSLLASTTGYQKPPTDANGDPVSVESYEKTATIIKKLKAGKKYFVRVRTYMDVDGKKILSKWSGIKSARTR